MNKEHFNSLVANYSDLKDQSGDLDKLIQAYPYSQPVRMLDVKSVSTSSKKEFQKRLALAAFYTTDRNVLRSLIEKGKVPSDENRSSNSVKPKPAVSVKKPSVKKITKPETTKLAKTTITPNRGTKNIVKSKRPSKTKVALLTMDAAKLRAEVLANLEILQQTKSNFLKLSEIEKPKRAPVKREVKKKTPEPPQVSKPKTSKTKPPQKKKLSPSSKDELIDKFIADKPSISRGKTLRENQSDLSKSSSKLKEDLVSENLAVIFAKQGKINKAIDIYKKLIWKFPQKKASFAARIEELKKKN